MINAVSTSNIDKSIANQSVNGSSANHVLQAIKVAADKTGVDFSYLLKKASQESSLDPSAKASTSSATGLYQFTSQTWLRSIKTHGADYGLSDYASHITIDSSGIAHVDSKEAKHAILKLRHDPTISAEMAAELDKDNLATLKGSVGGKLGATELYLAHFLGAGGARDFLKTMKANPNAKAADILPEAASANNGVFYSSNGEARSLKQVYNHFAQKFDTTKSATTLVASNVPVKTHDDLSTLSRIVPTNIAPAFTIAENSVSSLDRYTPLNPYSAAASAYSAGLTGSSDNSNSRLNVGTDASLYATMVMAQLNVGGMAALSSSDKARDADKDDTKKNAININLA